MSVDTRKGSTPNSSASVLSNASITFCFVFHWCPGFTGVQCVCNLFRRLFLSHLSANSPSAHCIMDILTLLFSELWSCLQFFNDWILISWVLNFCSNSYFWESHFVLMNLIPGPKHSFSSSCALDHSYSGPCQLHALHPPVSNLSFLLLLFLFPFAAFSWYVW